MEHVTYDEAAHQFYFHLKNTHIQLVQIFEKGVLRRRTFFVRHDTSLPARWSTFVRQKEIFKNKGSFVGSDISINVGFSHYI